MKSKVSLCCSLFLLAVLVAGAPAWAAQVQVCHVPPGNPGNFHTITINDNVLPAHLAHGDLAGPCSANCSRLCDDGNACTVDACDASGRCAVSHPPVSCDDGNLCTDDICNSTTGCASTPKTCQDDLFCTVDSCDPLTGACVFPPVACPSGQACNAGTGSCENQNPCPCSDENVVTADTYFVQFVAGNIPITSCTTATALPVPAVTVSDSGGSYATVVQLDDDTWLCGENSGSPSFPREVTEEEFQACAQQLEQAANAAGVTCAPAACSPNPCQNGGTCMAGGSSYTCTCTSGWTGTNCEVDVDECAATPPVCGPPDPLVECINLPGTYACPVG